MNKLSAFFLFVLIGCNNAETDDPSINKIIIEIQTNNKDFAKESQQLAYRRSRQVEFGSEWKYKKAKTRDGIFRWRIDTNEPLQINARFGLLYMSPGDSLHIQYEENRPVFSGIGSAKTEISNSIKEIEKELPPPTLNSFTIASMQNYLDWCKYVDIRLNKHMEVLKIFEGKLNQAEAKYMKSVIVVRNEIDRLQAFTGLQNFCLKNKIPASSINLSKIWDSTQNNEYGNWVRSIPDYYGETYYLYLYNKLDVFRRFDFSADNDSLNIKGTRVYLYYNNAKQRFIGLSRERLLLHILDEQTITEMGTKYSMSQTILKDYYSQPGFPEYKKLVKQLEEKSR